MRAVRDHQPGMCKMLLTGCCCCFLCHEIAIAQDPSAIDNAAAAVCDQMSNTVSKLKQLDKVQDVVTCFF